jgi:hypothetical protein
LAAEDIAFEWSEIGPLAGRNKLKLAVAQKTEWPAGRKEEFVNRLGHRPRSRRKGNRLASSEIGVALRTKGLHFHIHDITW